MLEPGYGYIRVRNFQERTGEDLAKALRDFYKQGELKGLVLDVRSDPGGLLNQAVAVSAAFLPKDALVVYTDGRTPDATHAPHRLARALHARPRRGLSPRSSRRRQEGADGRAGRRRHRLGFRDRRRRAAGPQARDGHGRADVRQGLGADDPAARQQRRPQADDGALLHAGGRSIQAKGIEPDIAVDDGRDSPNRIREANLERHLDTSKAGGALVPPPGASAKPSTPDKDEKLPPPPRFDFGAPAEDFQLRQALNHLKGEPVIASIRTQQAAATPAGPATAKQPAAVK